MEDSVVDMTFQDLPGWSFEMIEVSAGVYKVIGRHSYGRIVSAYGEDGDSILAKCKENAREINDGIGREI